MIGTRGRAGAGANITEILEREVRAHFPEAAPEDINEAVTFGTRLLETLQVGAIETSPCAESVNAVYAAALAKVPLITTPRVRLIEIVGQKIIQLACQKMCSTSEFSSFSSSQNR